MVFDVNVAMTWLLFLALFPMSFVWLRRAWRIQVRKDHSEVALKRGLPPPDPARWAPYEALLNAVAGGVALAVIVGVVVFALPYSAWSAIAGTTLWCKLLIGFALSRSAHAKVAGAAPKA